jgi:hypothetical protein
MRGCECSRVSGARRPPWGLLDLDPDFEGSLNLD